MFENQQFMPPPNQGGMPASSGQFGGGGYAPLLGRGLHRNLPMFGGQGGGFPMPQGLGQIMNGLKGGPGGMLGPQGMFRGMPGGMPSGGMPGGMSGGNPGWQAGPQMGGQGYAAPGYPPQGFSQPQQQQVMPQAPAQGYPSQGYFPQGQGYNQGYGGQMPVQPAWEEPKKGGIKEFLSNLMSKRKR